MGRKHRAGKLEDPGDAAGFSVNPFAGLSADALGIPKEEKRKTPPPPPPRPADPLADLSADDRALLKALGNQDLVFEMAPPVRGTVSLQMQRKGKGGKTVTRILGIKELDSVAEMELLGRLKKELGTGAQVNEGVIELQGDLRRRAAEWFEKHNYRVKG